VSNRRKCLDFCYWEVIHDTDHGGAENETDGGYSATNIADPHQATFLSTISITSSWRCALDAASDDALWSNIESKLTRPGYFGSEFPYLQCARGAGEVLEANADIFVKSEGVWWVLAIIGFTLVLLQFMHLLLSLRSGLLRHEQSDTSHTSHSYQTVHQAHTFQEERDNVDGHMQHGIGNAEEVPAEHEFQDEMLMDDGELARVANQFSKRRRCHRVVCFMAINIGIVSVLTISIASMIDIRGKRLMSSKAMRLTPKCYSPYSECAEGNSDIDRPSKQRDDHIPFSYIVASDAQLDWYDGESPDIGRLATPRPCSETDSCSSCSAKVGSYTNELMRKSIEILINDERYEPDYGRSNILSPSPKTLVLNGDLTAYFHPRERSKYESIYNNIDGLKAIYPALGNHELEHGSGSTYNADQWVGSQYCNSRHAMGYIRSGFCGNIPNFDPGGIVRYDASSLAYSWEEGRYHFVHTHYFPAFESAGLDLKSSIAWLERDVSLAHQANLTTILFVHASQGLNDAMQRVLLGKNVAAIFAGHSHRCLMRKCVAPAVVYENQIGNHTDNSTSPSVSSKLLPPESYDECLPGTTGVCGGNAGTGGMSLYYLQNKSDDLVPPSTELFYEPHISEDRKLCPAPPQIAIVNNTLLCRRAVMADSEFPPREVDDAADSGDKGEHIPIFWSGSASFQTFLKVDYYVDRFTVNVMTAVEGMEGRRYMDMHSVPSVVYPYHEREDMDEVTVIL